MSLRHLASISAILLSACSSTAVRGPTLYDDGHQNAPGCPIPATYQGQPGQPGAFCTDAALDCEPACCQCSGVADSFWASECVNETCQDSVTACNDAPSASLCTF